MELITNKKLAFRLASCPKKTSFEICLGSSRCGGFVYPPPHLVADVLAGPEVVDEIDDFSDLSSSEMDREVCQLATVLPIHPSDFDEITP